LRSAEISGQLFTNPVPFQKCETSCSTPTNLFGHDLGGDRQSILNSDPLNLAVPHLAAESNQRLPGGMERKYPTRAVVQRSSIPREVLRKCASLVDGYVLDRHLLHPFFVYRSVDLRIRRYRIAAKPWILLCDLGSGLRLATRALSAKDDANPPNVS
jgi:hypothetical protein